MPMDSSAVADRETEVSKGGTSKPRLLDRPIRLRQVMNAITACSIVALTALVVGGLAVTVGKQGYVGSAGVIIVVGMAGPALLFMERCRRYPSRVATVFVGTHLRWSSEGVWQLIKPAENAPVLNASIRRGFHVPGTPDGLGEKQALEYDTGLTVITEIIEYEPGRRAVTRMVSPPGFERIRWFFAVDPVEGGCVYTQAIEVDLRAGQRLRQRYERDCRQSFDDQAARVRAALQFARPATPGAAH
jgi:hypothetical protein